jgi:two-component system sensor histidine kinase VicK
MKDKRNFHLKKFIFYQTVWAVLCAAFAFLFILLQGIFKDPELLNMFIVSWWIYVAVAAVLALLTNGAFRLLGINIEFEDSYWINTKVVNERIENNISDKDLVKLFHILKKEPLLTFKKESAFSGGVVLASLFTMFFWGAPPEVYIFIVTGGVIAILMLGFFSLFVEEQTYAPVLRDARAKLKERELEVKEKDSFRLKQRFNYFIFLFFLLLVIILSFAQELDVLLRFIILLSFIAVITANEMLASSVYSVFQEVAEFADKLPKNSNSRMFSGSYFKEAVTISANFNKSADKLKEIDQAVREEKNKIRTIINNFTYPIIFIGEDGRIDMFNVACQKVPGLKESDIGVKISSKNDYDIENFKKIFRIKNYRIKEPKESEGYVKGWKELEIKENGKEMIYKVVTKKVYGENGQLLGVLKIFNDLTREEAINRMKSEFISVAAHQLRTPLSAIKWVLRMILDKDAGHLNKIQEEYMGKGYKSTERVIELVDNLLYVSRIEEGRFGYSFQVFNSEKMLDEAVEDIRNKAEEKKMEFSVKKIKNMPNIYGDPEKLKMAIYYILDNAVKYTRKNGKVLIEVKNKNRKKDLAFKIKDNGVGIPTEGKEELFSKFYRASNVLRMQTDGNGLGLFIVKSIIEKHKGNINIDSKEGEGTEVELVIPIREDKKKLGSG